METKADITSTQTTSKLITTRLLETTYQKQTTITSENTNPTDHLHIERNPDRSLAYIIQHRLAY